MHKWLWIQKQKKKETQPPREYVKIHGTSEVFSANMHANLEEVDGIIGGNPDVVIRHFYIEVFQVNAAVVFIKGIADRERIHEQILKSIMLHYRQASSEEKSKPVSPNKMKDAIKNLVLTVSDVKEVKNIEECIMNIFIGETALFIEGSDTVLILGTKDWPSRSIEEPISEATVRGSREGFVENVLVNISLIRRRIRDPNLKMTNYTIGRRSQTPIVVMHMKDITNEKLLDEVKTRIESIDIDQVPESGIIEQLMEDDFLSPFPQMLATERPDKVAQALLEGRVVVLVDGTPFVLVMPMTIISILQSPEDYYERFFVGTLVRFMRIGAAFISLFAPSLYVALVSYHPGLIPSDLVISIAASREGVPFPSIVEALMMEVTIELLREAGVRLPKPIGQTVGIVGGLVIGEAAVSAGLVSAMMVIVVAVTAVSSFALPQYGVGIALRILRFGMMLSAAFLGLFGIMMFAMIITIHLVKLKSFGVEYTAPLVPYQFRDWKDALLRFPYRELIRRPDMLKPKESIRMKDRSSKWKGE